MSPKAERDWRLYADDIIEACGKVRRFVAGMTYDAFAADERTRDAVIRNLEIIGEAAGKLPEEVRAKAPEIPLRLICDMRNVLAHAHFGVSVKIVWDRRRPRSTSSSRLSEHCSSDVHDQQARTHEEPKDGK